MYELTEERVVPVSAPKAAAAPSYGAFGNRRLLWTAIVIFAVTAWFSEGFIHPDEHFQILEFANYKLGRTPSADLQWEFPAELRPGLQPMLGFGFIRAAEAVGLASPFMQVFVIRLITGFLSLAVFLAWSRALRRLPESRQAGERLPWLVAFLWFVPFLSVRFSSENLAALTFWAGLLLIIRGLFGIDVTRGRAALLSLAGGSLLGLSFYFRFQMGFALVGAAAWIGWQLATRRQGRVPVRNLFLVLVGAAAAAALGTLADYWLYGELVFTPYRYLDTNLLHGKAAEFGASPWWWYFQRIGLREGPPIGLLLLGLAAVGLWSHRRHVMAWVFIPFVCGHLLIAHKELRFLFPMLLPFLVLALFGFDRLAALRPGRLVMAGVYLVGALAVGANFVLLPARSLLPPEERVRCFRFLYGLSRTQPLVLFSENSSIYQWNFLTYHFYRDDRIQSVVVGDPQEGMERAASVPGGLWVSRSAAIDVPRDLQAHLIYGYLPWRPDWNWLTRGENRYYVWSVQRRAVIAVQ